MIDLERALADQRNLEALFEPPDLSASVEKYLRNDCYGFAGILKEYADYDPELPVEAVVPHGVYLDAERVVQEELEAPVPAVLNYPAFRTTAWEGASDKKLIPSTCPFVYALSLFRNAFPDPPSERSGTLFFPAHGTEVHHHDVAWEHLLGDLQALDDEKQPVTVCIYYSDYKKGHHLAFLDAGLDVVSAGNPWDQDFLYRWLHLLSRHRFAAGNNIGGCAYYSVKAGYPFLLVGETPSMQVDPTLQFLGQQMGLAYRATSPQMRETADRIRAVFGEQADTSLEVIELTDYLLGCENLKSSRELHEDLSYAAGLAAET